MSLFTWQDVTNEAKRLGVDLSRRSAADQKLLQTDPDRAMRALDIWAGWSGATPEQQALDHQWMEDWRRSAGYSGGGDGSGYTYLGLGSRSGGSGSYASAVDGAWNALNAAQPYSASVTRPSYDPSAEQRWNERLDALLSYGDFSYDAAADPLYSQYRKTYLREGRRAGEDAVARASELTGGQPSSYALGAASQAENYYAAQMADKLPELEQRAYQRWAQGRERLLSDYNAAAQAAQFSRQRYQDELDQYNADRGFDYGLYTDGYRRSQDNLSAATALEDDLYQREQTQRAEGLKAAALMAALGDYSGYAPWYGQDWADRMQALYNAAQGAQVPAAGVVGGTGLAQTGTGRQERSGTDKAATVTAAQAVPDTALGTEAQTALKNIQRSRSYQQTGVLTEKQNQSLQNLRKNGRITAAELSALLELLGVG